MNEDIDKLIDDILNNQPDDEDKVIDVKSVNDNTNNTIIMSDKSYYVLPYYSNNKFIDNKEYIKFIKACEKVVRTSEEYSKYIGYLKEIGLNKCSFLNNITDDDAPIEFHHYPFTLFDICSIVLEHKLNNNEQVNTFLVAKEVIECHWKNIIGLVPLCETVHELYHAGLIFINLNMVYGRYNKFIEEYNPNQNYIKDYNELVALSKNNTQYSENDILEKIKKYKEQ
jgi:hypothetical protein